jgi:putative phage-type endonuclease
MYLNDLPELTDILHTINSEDIHYFNHDETIEIYDTCIHIMEEFIENNPKIISEPEFDDIFDENIYELMHSTFDYDIYYTDEAQEELEEIISYAREYFFKTYMPPRSYSESIILNNSLDYDYITKQIDYLHSKPQPVQRTKEWYNFRRNLITASNAYKAFENDTIKNQLIYEKCTGLEDTNDDDDDDDDIKKISISKMVNINSTLHWGQKYEPVSVQIYENMYNTKVGDFGCIQDDKYSFLGASPDGINIDPNSERYGRMLEIKNIVNREIDGIPKKEYWIQMQLQMHVCRLNECDFLETQFIEYETSSDYWEDSSDKRKGIIMYFHTKDGSPYYEYMPLNILDYDEVNKWLETMVDKYQSEPYNYVWIKDYYWKLQQFSCVLVLRNEKWFELNIHDLIEIWTIIEKERVTGFEHRTPKKRIKKELNTSECEEKNNDIKCLLLPNVSASINNNNSKIIYIDTSNIIK